MDLSEALKFNSKECVKKSEVEPTLSRNRSGLTHSCASSNGTALFHYLPQTQTITLYQSSTNYTPLSQFHAKDVIHMSCSFDGRLLLLLHSDSSVTCIDVTSGGMTVRFTLQDVHSHSSVYGMHTVGKRLRANIHRGPVHSVTFNNTSGYDCLVVDAVKGIMVIDCQAGGIKRTISNQSLPSNILCADWDYNGEDGDLVAGFEDGSIALMHTQDDMEIIIPDAVEENDEEVNWSCTHIQSFPNHIAVGLCRVFDGEDENDNDISEEDLDEDDEASHEANLLIYSRESREWTELGDVVAFFAVPMFGRHVFYTTFLSKQNILLVGCNVTGEAGIVAETDGEWQVCELQEGDNATTPLTEDDEFTLPTGLSCVPDGSSHLNLVMSSTDGSLSVFDIEHIEDDKFAVSESVGPWAVTNATVEETVLQEEKNAAVETTREVEEIQGTDKDSNAETSVVEEAEQNQEKEGVTSAFGSGSSSGFSFGTSTATTPAFGSATSKPVFGSTTPFGSPSTSTPTSAPFGGAVFGSTSGLSSTTSSFGSPAFGLSSVKQGAFSLASKATQSESAPQLSEAEKNAPVFGSGSSAPVFGSGTTPAFGSGSSAPVFGSGTKPTFGTTSSGFGSLAQSSVNGFGALASTVTSESKEFGFNNTPRKQQSIFGMSTPIDKTKLDSSMIKPLFREQSPVKDGNLDRANPTKNTRDDIVDIVPSTAQAKHAEKAFDIIDQDKAQKVPTSKLDELVDEVGEGLHGDELDKQLAILDPDSTGYITRTSFIHWYCKLVEGSDDDDDGSLDTDEREEREEERNKATDAFDSVANAGIIHKSEFGDLMEAMGTTYCEEEHRRTLRKISDDDGNITQEAFVSWYMDWLFGDGDSDSDYSDEENDETDQQDSTAAAAAASSTGWGSTFAVDKDSWKCESCMLRNKGSDVKCVACETVRPGHEDKVTAVDKKDTPSSSTGSGFTFSSANASVAGGGGSSGGFSFGFSGTPAPAPSSTMTTTTTTGGGSGGFSFGFSGTPAPAPAPATSSTDKKEGEADSKSTTGFSFTTPASKLTFASNNQVSSSSSSAFPPMSAKAPTPFGATTKTAASTSKPASSSAAFPPMSAKAPTPFSSSTPNPSTTDTAKKTTTASSTTTAYTAAAFPPMSAKAPTPFGASSATNVKTTSSSTTTTAAAAFPPMSAKAPTPFGAASSSSTTDSTTASSGRKIVKAARSKGTGASTVAASATSSSGTGFGFGSSASSAAPKSNPFAGVNFASTSGSTSTNKGFNFSFGSAIGATNIGGESKGFDFGSKPTAAAVTDDKPVKEKTGEAKEEKSASSDSKADLPVSIHEVHLETLSLSSPFFIREKNSVDNSVTEKFNLPKPLKLVTSGIRGIVDCTAASDIVLDWTKLLDLKKSELIMITGNNDISGFSLCSSIVLSNKSYQPDAAEVICQFIEKHSLDSHIKVLDMSDVIASQPESEGLQVLKILSSSFANGSIEELDLSDNAMGSKGITACSPLLSLPSLRRLKLCNNGLSETSMMEVVSILSTSGVCGNLKQIHFYNNMSGDGGCQAFADILRLCSRELIDIRFSSTRASREGSLVIAKALQGLISGDGVEIERLDLADNSFGIESTRELCQLLKCCSKLQYLDLRDCLLGDDGFKILVNALVESSCDLQYFDVSANDLTKDASHDIRSLLKHKPNLSVFRAEENELQSQGIACIVKSISGSVTKLHLGANECGSAGAKAIIEAKSRLSQLTSLGLDENMFSTEDIDILEATYGKVLIPIEDNLSDECPEYDDDFELSCDSDEASYNPSSGEVSFDREAFTETNINRISTEQESIHSNASTLSSANSMHSIHNEGHHETGNALMTLEKEWTDLKDSSPLKLKKDDE